MAGQRRAGEFNSRITRQKSLLIEETPDKCWFHENEHEQSPPRADRDSGDFLTDL
jgi:hypothetical protein